MDSDEENDTEYVTEESLAGFMFGNIDENGMLENNIFDSNTQEHLTSLRYLGLGSLFHEMLPEQSGVIEEDDESEVEESDENLLVNSKDSSRVKDHDYLAKDAKAVDFSNINEVVEDSNDVKEPSRIIKTEKESGYEADNEELQQKTKSVLSLPVLEEEPMVQKLKSEEEKKKNTPLASLLPSKYFGVDVKEFFPDFRVDKTLRFSKIFGPGKPNNLPKYWRAIRKRRKRKLEDEINDSDTDSDRSNKKLKIKEIEMNYGSKPNPDQLSVDDEDKFLQPMELEENSRAVEKPSENGDAGIKCSDWRFGPAQIWYDNMGVPETVEIFDYGFKLAEKIEEEKSNLDDFPEDAFLMVTQRQWEDDIIWSSDDLKQKMKGKYTSNIKNNVAGWIPTRDIRQAQQFSQTSRLLTSIGSNYKSFIPQMSLLKNPMSSNIKSQKDDTWYSIFPVENEELVYDLWEDEIIWDPQAMKKIPKPKIVTLDPNDENIILGIPEDVDPESLKKDNVPQPKIKPHHPHAKRSRVLLGKAGVINVLEEDDAPPTPPDSPSRDPFNISNDSYYMPKSLESSMKMNVGGRNFIQHSIPVVELRAPFIPTHMGPTRLRNFHRPPLKKFSNGPMAYSGPHSVVPLTKYIKKKAKLRQQERIASGGGDVFFMRTADDLTGRDGELVLLEFSEEYPPLINQVGMCSKFKNYYKRKVGKDNGPPDLKYGETAYAHNSPFLGILKPGQTIQAVENNLYRAPIYEHNVGETDFLIIRTRMQYYIREFDGLFVAGQECPLYEVPGPNSKKATNFVRDFLQVFIYRLFWKSKEVPRKIKMEDVKKAFPGHSETSIRKRLKLCADFKRTGMDSNWWVLRSDFRLPTEEELRSMVSPEQCCAHYSMISAEQRLKDAGYGEKNLFTPEDDNDEGGQLKMDDEIKVAPWNTTRAYTQAMKGKCLLQLSGPADPTGCGQGFSYVRVPNKPVVSKEEQEAHAKRIVTGTDADLRRLSLKKAREFLRKSGIPEEKIMQLSRWEVIDVVRTLSTEKAKAGEEGMDKFSRGNRFSTAEYQERYKEECQYLFNLQNTILSSNEVLSTDDGESSEEEEEDSDIEEMGKNIESMLSNKKTTTEFIKEREEQEREELKRMMMNENLDDKKLKKDDENSNSSTQNQQSNRILKIIRTHRDELGRTYKRVEIVRKPSTIEAYLKIRNTKDENFIRNFAMDDAQKEEIKREKRRIQEQLRRIRRNEKRMENIRNSMPFNRNNLANGASNSLSSSSHFDSFNPNFHKNHKKNKLKPDLKLKCGACGQVGHMRTNKACPLYLTNFGGSLTPEDMNGEQDFQEIDSMVASEEEDLVNVDGTKVILSTKVIKHAEEEAKRKANVVLKLPKDMMSLKKRKRPGSDNYEYTKRYQRPAGVHRSRISDPKIIISSIFEGILADMRELPYVNPFLLPVNTKLVPDYLRIINKPMDLQKIRDNLRKQKYQSREEFLADVNQIKANSQLYNGTSSPLTQDAQRLFDFCAKQILENDDRLMLLEKAINPLLDDNDQVAFSFVLNTVISDIKNMQEATAFLKPVNKKLVTDYYNIVKNPMDLDTMSKKAIEHKYHSRAEFLSDIQLIVDNCKFYNGVKSPLTTKAEKLVEAATQTLAQFEAHLMKLEGNISRTKRMAMAEAGVWMDESTEDENHIPASTEREALKITFSDEDDIVDVVGDGDIEMGKSSTVQNNTIEINIPSKDQNNDVEINKMTNIQKKDVLEEDLQCSSEDEFHEVPFENGDIFDTSEEKPVIIEIKSEELSIDNSQQVVETIQLGNTEEYIPEIPSLNPEESIDSNFDPDSFFSSIPMKIEKEKDSNLHDDLAVSDSDDDVQQPKVTTDDQPSSQTDDDLGSVWF